MELSKNDTKILKGVGIFFMVILHLFARKDVEGLYETLILINGVPLEYYIGHFGDACRPIYLFASGYAFYIVITKESDIKERMKRNGQRILKLLINYWVVLVLFVFLGFLFTGEEGKFPGSITNFLLNFFVLSNSYNGAWWFLQVYIILVILSPFIIHLIKNYNYIFLILIAGFIYSISYLQFYKDIFNIEDGTVLAMLVRTSVLIGTSLFSFVIGAVFAKEKTFTYLHKKFYNYEHRNMACYMGILILLIFHSVVESTSIAPLTGISFVCFFVFMEKSNFFKKILNILADHSTNIWLTHMFFYLTIFPALTFAPKYPILILLWLLILCIGTSYIIKGIYTPVFKRIDRYKTTLQYDNEAVS